MQGDLLSSLLPLVVLFVIFWFLVIRPQQMQAKKHKEMLNALTKGDKIITNGGLVAEVVNAEGDFIKVKLNDDVIVRLDRAFVAKKYEDIVAEVKK
ncbi:MAG: preprotein translocase subunit YajC [Campylobacter sp.]|uniref:preprotein translocase subunit YajC n=1 Tax=Campylobacter sp. TaxID=205 RepID=UPI002A503CA7|nr:preprotein translocase subunit YajC [Campylobacter sp.]MDD7090971.1 preprotein translocase subunit YajC [Campylobacteraceae bacterium]MCI6178095.1 preprotein translocase subunit YajC [Campylobacter sp.]MCI6299355.1 preprotein translocase subunit YajC [Campylobacter sp.]MCI7014487.1 preprotein translocase subunit YajC [Campylobacter sp.]MCI7501088.1 preprotein translocase subunit YajC [Campylobacter sp.]